MPQELVLIRGVPGSGKSTLAWELSENETKYKIVEADGFFNTLKAHPEEQYKFDAKWLSYAHSWCQSVAACYLYHGESVIVANTFIKWFEFLPYVELAKKAKVPLRVIHCKGDFKSVHNVPTETIERMKSTFHPKEKLKIDIENMLDETPLILEEYTPDVN